MTFESPLVVNPNIIFTVEDTGIVAWNCKSHVRYALSLEAVRALVDVDFRHLNPPSTAQLSRAGILSCAAAAPEDNWKWDVISKIFHFGTMFKSQRRWGVREGELSYFEFCASIMGDMPPDAFSTSRGNRDVELQLTPGDHVAPLLELLEERRSSRTFSGGEIDFADISLILDETFRYRPHDVKAFDKAGVSTPTWRRSAPSAGSLQSCEAYLIARRVVNLESGVYHYRSHQSNLGLIDNIGDEFSIGELLCEQMFADDLSAVIVISCRFDKLMWKYEESWVYRVALFDAGHLSQTAQLIATALGVRTWVTAAFYDAEVGALLKLSEECCEYPLLVVGLGTGDPNPFDRDWGLVFGQS